MKVLILNGPNLSRLDLRDKGYYGDLKYPELVAYIEKVAKEVGLNVDVRQSDDEAQLISWLHEAADNKTPIDRKSTRLNSSHSQQSRMPSSA